MGGKKKRARAGQATPPAPERGPDRGGPPWILIGGSLAAVAVVAALAVMPSSDDAQQTQAPESEVAAASETDTAESGSTAPVAPPPPPPAARTPRPPAGAPLPPLPLVSNLVPRSPQVIRDAYIFAAQNPDVLEYVPCFCGCETRGHKRNADCFVQSRNPDGSVREWDTHGMACIICVDVARDAMQLNASGARVSDIRAAVESKYAAYGQQTPTPAPPEAAN